MRAELIEMVAQEAPIADGAQLESLLDLFAAVNGPIPASSLRRRLSQQVMRAIEISVLADATVLDVALNPGLYLGQESQVLANRLTDLLGITPPVALVQHLRS